LNDSIRSARDSAFTTTEFADGSGQLDMIRNTVTRWGSVSRGLHWLLAVAIIGMIGFGWWMNHIPARPDRYFYRSIHADIGYLVLLLLVLRLIWRSFNPAPMLPPETPAWERWLARANQWALDLVAITVTMLGWAHSGAHTPDYASWFGLFQLPQITAPDKAAADAYEDRHILFAYVLLALIVIHIGAALWHRLIKRDAVVSRMVRGEA
jgi:cytochrome b561